MTQMSGGVGLLCECMRTCVVSVFDVCAVVRVSLSLCVCVCLWLGGLGLMPSLCII